MNTFLEWVSGLLLVLSCPVFVFASIWIPHACESWSRSQIKRKQVRNLQTSLAQATRGAIVFETHQTFQRMKEMIQQ